MPLATNVVVATWRARTFAVKVDTTRLPVFLFSGLL